VNFRLPLPEIRLQTTLNLQMIELELDDRNVLGKIAPYVGFTNVQSCDAMSLGMSFHYHTYLLSNADDFSLGSQV
jgi:hypothetical protein